MTTKLDKTSSPAVAPRIDSTPAAAPVAPAQPAHPASAPTANDLFGALPAPSVPNRLVGLISDPESVRARGPSNWVVVSSHDDDPFVNRPVLEKVDRSDFTLDENGKPTGLVGPRVAIETEGVIYRQDDKGAYKPFANNPWPEAKPNKQGNFVFQSEPRFPTHLIERGEDGKPVLDKDGLQIWKPRELFLGKTTVFEAVNTSIDTVEAWSGRHLPVGYDGQLPINSQAFVGFNAFFSPGARALFFGVVPYRLPGETEIKMFETASSWEIASHEAGHALHRELKPKIDAGDVGFRTWGESFGDQLAMFGSLADRDKAKALLREVGGDLNKSNSATRIGEVFASLVGEGTGLRDHFHNKTVENTTDEVHDRSEVLTGAVYKVFNRVYKGLRAEGMKEVDAVQKAAETMGQLLTRVADHTPENTMSFEDVAKAYIKADREYFGGKLSGALTEEFTRRGVFDADSIKELDAREAALPKGISAGSKDPEQMKALLTASLDKLGLQGFGLEINMHQVDKDGRQVVRVTLMDGDKALKNQGLLVFRPDGSLSEFQSPLPPGLDRAEAQKLLADAKKQGLDKEGHLGLRKKAEGEGFTVTVEKFEGEGVNSQIRVFSLEKPDGVLLNVEHDDAQEKYAHALPQGAILVDPAELAGA